MEIIVGIDPGLSCAGWGVVTLDGNQVTYLDSGAVMTEKNAMSLGNRLLRISNEIDKVIDKFHPTIVSIEKMFVNANYNSSMKLGMAFGVISLVCAKKFVPVKEYSTTEIKKMISSSGKADKSIIYRSAISFINSRSVFLEEIICKKERTIKPIITPVSEEDMNHNYDDDALDAVAVAFCGAANKYLEFCRI